MKKSLTRHDAATTRYTVALTRIFKSSIKNGQPLHVSGPNDDGYIFVTNGVILVKLNQLEYDELIRPITQRDPAAYVLYKNGLMEGREPLDMEKVLADSAKKSTAPADLAPFTFAIDKKANGTFFYNSAADAVVIVNADFVSAFTACGTFKAGGPSAPVVIDQGGEEGPDPIGLILPIRPSNEKLCTAVRAYYTDQPTADAAQLQQERDRLRRKVEDLITQNNNGDAIMTDQQNKICDLLDQRDALAAQVATLQAQLAALQAQPQDKIPQAAGKAEPVKALLDKLQIPYIVKGAQTASPVLWTTADPGDHAAELKAAGMAWSAKRNAWYIKAA